MRVKTKIKQVMKFTVRHGFTLVEMLISIAIFGILASVVLVNMSQSKVREEVGGVANELAGRIVDAKQRALSGASGAPTSAGYACAFGVSIMDDLNDGPVEGRGYYVYSWDCKGTDASSDDDVLAFLHTSINGNVRVAKYSSEGEDTVLFAVPFGEMMYPNLGTFDIKVWRGSAEQHVCVSNAGKVTVRNSPCP